MVAERRRQQDYGNEMQVVPDASVEQQAEC
jgi:hypothetical protein